jgi:iron complex outermembrane receptor protein
VDYTSGSQVGGTADIGRRFGDNNQFGVRFNAVNREGGTEVDGEKKRTTAASIGLDYRGDRLRTSLDMGYQKKTFHHARNGINISGIDFIPDVPKNASNYSQKWIFSDIQSEFGLAKAEYDLTDQWTAYAALGAQHTHEVGNYGTPKVLNSEGDATIGRFQTNRVQDNMSGMVGLRGDFTTGPVTHKVNIGYSAMTANAKNTYRMSYGNDADTNIYDTHDVAQPDTVYSGGTKFGDPLTTYRSRSQGYLLSDTLGFFDDTLLATLGARHQKVVVRNYGYDGAEDPTTRFSRSHWLPAYGLLYKATDSVSLYANHTESLTPGTAAPFGTDNYGSVTGIIHAKQNEVGVKADFGRVGGSLALFEIKQPVGIKNNNVYTLSGEQRNRGVELNVFGEPVLGLRLNGSTTWIDPDMTKTGDSNEDGKTAIGVPRFTAALGAEYDIKPIDGLTATALLNYTGSQYANLANTMKMDSYTTLDLGLRYRMKVNQNDMVWRVGVDNVTNEKYWANVDDSGTYLTQGDPRTVKVSMSYDF